MTEFRSEGYINELNIGYNTEMEGCMNSYLDTMKLGEIDAQILAWGLGKNG